MTWYFFNFKPTIPKIIPWFSRALNASLSGRFLVGLTNPGDGCVGIFPSNALIFDLMDVTSFSPFSDLKQQLIHIWVLII